MARDNFSKKIIEKLRTRVANRCSKPECRVPTTAPSQLDGVNIIGVAAHITAASPGGPRYDSQLDSTARKSIDNAIWLCSNCSIDIDKDQKRYSVELLKLWKQKAEETARAELGKKLPSEDDTINTLTAALTGLGTSFLPTAISNVHTATGKALESLDERFIVKSEFNGNQTKIEIHARENVPLNMIINDHVVKSFQEKYLELIEHGEDVEIDSSSLRIQGSKLFEEIFKNPDGILKISPPDRQATQKLWLVQKETNLVESFDDIYGQLKIGSKSFSFNGRSCAEIFKTSFRMPLTAEITIHKVDLNFSINYELWEGLNVQQLPYFEKLLSVFQKMASGWTIFTTLEIDGNKLVTSQGIEANESEFVQFTNGFLHYIKRCRVIANALNVDIFFKTDVLYTANEHKRLADIANAIQGKQEFNSKDIKQNLSSKIIVTSEKENIDHLLAIDNPINFQMVQNQSETVELFGVLVELPPKVFYLISVTPLVHGDIDDIKPGDTVDIEWLTNDESKIQFSYQL